MKVRVLALGMLMALAVPVIGWAGDHPDLTTVMHLMDSARIMEAHVFAPEAWGDAEKEYANARRAVQENKKEKSIQKHVTRAREYTENAIKVSQVAKLSMESYLESRAKARVARAPMLVPEQYAEAEKVFMKATEKVEKGDVKGGLKEAAKSTPLFDEAELNAIRADLLGAADNLIEKARADEAHKYAVATLDRAQTTRAKADAILLNDRYERTESLPLIAAAEYEARHASNIAMSVRSLERNDQAWEKLMLIYEIQMNRVGDAIGLEHLPFDHGPLAAADTLVSYIRTSQADRRQLSEENQDLTMTVGERLRSILARVGESPGLSDPGELAQLVDERFTMLMLERDDLSSQVQTSEIMLRSVEREHEEVAAELGVLIEQEARFQNAKKLIRPSEGAVLFNASNDVVLRLSGLSFDIGSAEIRDDHLSLLDRVVEIIQMFPDAELVVEGHTDALGDQASNLQLSERRAYALMMYLRNATGMSSDRIRAIGYGSERPIASNETSRGRSKNRRNDIIIMH